MLDLLQEVNACLQRLGQPAWELPAAPMQLQTLPQEPFCIPEALPYKEPDTEPEPSASEVNRPFQTAFVDCLCAQSTSGSTCTALVEAHARPPALPGNSSAAGLPWFVCS